MEIAPPDIKDLAVIGDRRTCAYIDKSARVVWYCPSVFDAPAIFAGLLDMEKGGHWRIGAPSLRFIKRSYRSDSTVLCTTLSGAAGELEVEDWMPMQASFNGICRTLSAAPEKLQIILAPRPNFARQKPKLQLQEGVASIDGILFLYASHPLRLNENTIFCDVPAGEKSWFVLSEQEQEMNWEVLQQAHEATKEKWKEVTSHITYHGPYEDEVRNSLRVLRLMTFAENGGIIAAGTTSLPEVKGSHRNYDYRYVWLRDAAMIASALTRAGSDGEEERKFLSFICDAMHQVKEPVVPFFTLKKQPAPGEEELQHLRGYADSLPVRVGNNANNQLQLDAISNVLLAAKLIYNTFDTKEHWELVCYLADYLASHWYEQDHGLWEETQKQHYTSSKVIVAVSLEYISEHSEDKAQQERWKNAATDIRAFVAQECLTSEGAYAAFPGSEAVDVSAILFPIWAYTDADAPEVLQTIKVLERDYCQHNLFRRHLVDFDSSVEGAFLAGTFWVAQYYVMRRNWERFGQIMEAALALMNDVGLMPEEGDPETGEFLGNIPQTFVHASLIGAVIDYKKAREEEA
ncbi:glycoside hydrolase family 15 protein [Pontibacter akesuensis]|uniref:Glucoamylase (Glucan-1,4-alpha-glucosidase), GH15 family n=1 Tax=Pontibacter akesuensis TaxID=388950 RepID=A0A1I7GRZ3_9BACT|nr:glycoside hydrolase family 15 protein [Pontibacter akesuensis]GHA55388.1 glycosyl hydrolase [Pontibacter akesuensis]SFU51212.1 Glucoamylase (glucan-1,4-alpha-glucosidase), GH15 family [Pontibacter akesuensis]